jgi:hypothetical protein
MAQNKYDKRVFINCPFDAQFKPLFEAIVFAVLDCGLWPRCALEINDASQVRIDKVFNIIAECKYGVHDISRTEVHNDSVKEAITVVRNWLRNASGSRILPGGMEIYRRFQAFEQELPALCRELRLHRDELTFNDSASIIADWIRDNT